MYNLLVSGRDGTWDGSPWTIEASRCVCEYTDKEISRKFEALDAGAINELKKLPCIFAYETPSSTPP
ncbi:hypothetical protein Q6296_28825, partial [Klebsiella variicola]|nr:hypothetical protein [Klebsiella variicola]